MMDEVSKRPRKDRLYTPADRKLVEELASQCASLTTIAKRLGIDRKTLKAQFANELALGNPKVKAKIVCEMISAALDGDLTAQKFVLERRFGWTDKPNVVAPEPKTGTIPYRFSEKPGFPIRMVDDLPPDGWMGEWPPWGCIKRSAVLSER